MYLEFSIVESTSNVDSISQLVHLIKVIINDLKYAVFCVVLQSPPKP